MTQKRSQLQIQKTVLAEKNDVLGHNHLALIKELTDSSNFSWFYYSDIHRAKPEERQEWNIARHGFVHQLWFEDQQSSPYFNLFEPIVYKMADTAGVKYERLLRMQVNMMLNVGKEINGTEHTDGFAFYETKDLKWFSGCYYINDSDGYTTIHLPDAGVKHVEPVADSLVVFDGNLKHSAQLPLVHNRRVLVNINFLGS